MGDRGSRAGAAQATVGAAATFAARWGAISASSAEKSSRQPNSTPRELRRSGKKISSGLRRCLWRARPSRKLSRGSARIASSGTPRSAARATKEELAPFSISRRAR